MRWLFVLGFAAACSSSVDDTDQISAVVAGASGAETEGGSANVAGKTSSGGSSSAGAAAEGAGAPSEAGAGGDEPSSTGAGGAAGDANVKPSAGQGGRAPEGGAPSTTSGAGGEAAAGSSSGGEAGEGTGEPACVCSSGPCCDGCQYRPKSHFCGETVRDAYCSSETRITRDYWNLFCNADSSECTRWAVHTKYVDSPCHEGGSCVDGEIATCGD
jgi:hypothetical protein